MTYFGVLLRFVGIPLLFLTLITAYDARKGRGLPHPFRAFPAWLALLGHVIVALAYTTPWDNYLVATSVWWYDPALVTGLTLGWVPIEEYTFFVAQTLMTGLWLFLWMRRASAGSHSPALRGELRPLAAGVTGLFWAMWLVLLLVGWQAGRYMALILVWALPPIMLQLAFGADILWRYRRLAFLGIVPPTLYLWLVDGLAIRSGTWTISPGHIVGVHLIGILPLEEAVFFLVTNTLVVFGILLIMAQESHRRLLFWRKTESTEGDEG